ncbi:MAG: HAMP domain-containing histidine kinase [Lachnospiraceae bacterium]|nr:HAMP domain-containing histidine kinase [Lachnospiraceae bacterium]
MKRSSITKKMLIMALVCMLICTAVFLGFYISDADDEKDDIYADTIISLNEIDNMLDGDISLADVESNKDNIVFAKDEIKKLIMELHDHKSFEKKKDNTGLFAFYLLTTCFILLIFLLVYILILRPFERLEDFASELSKGNFDAGLKYDRVNMFGEFTWAFDHMRSELKQSREREQEAIDNNKTIIATLSHDIKTPVASIRAYAEGLSENMDSNPERRKRYIDVIMKKCDEVSKVTDDMFIHSLHDLDRLVINKDEIDLKKVINETIDALNGDKKDIEVKEEIDEFTLHEADSMRIAQVIENIITNARKYAGNSKIEIWSIINNNSESDDTVNNSNIYELHIKDNGQGIPPEDMPFVFDKFYRGKNKGDKKGAGLGLFIVKYIMEEMGRKVYLNNSREGLEVVLSFMNSNEL